MMNRLLNGLVAAVGLMLLVLATGCSATPIGAAMSLVGTAVNDLDAAAKAKEFAGKSSAECDQKLGQPINVFESRQPQRQWRVYSVKGDLTNNYRYLAEMDQDKVIAFSKAQLSGDLIVDAATRANFDGKCRGKTPQACQDSVGYAPALTARNVKTGEVFQLYDARLSKDLQKPYYAILRFAADNACCEIRVAKATSAVGEPVKP